MKSRQEIKAQAKYAVSRQRGTAIVLTVIVTLISWGGSALSFIPFLGWLITMALSLITIVLGVGIQGAFVKIYREEQTDLGEPFNALSVNFARKLGAQLLSGLIVALFSLLFVIPGVMRQYSYFCVPYILAEYPDVNATEALKISRRMMYGNRLEIFVMELSFIGWFLLSAFTLFILMPVYVVPYMSATQAGFYEEIKKQALADGVVSEAELGGAPDYAPALS